MDDVVDPWNVVSTKDTGIDYDKLIGTLYFMFCLNKNSIDFSFQKDLVLRRLMTNV